MFHVCWRYGNILGIALSTLTNWRNIKRAQLEPLAVVKHGLTLRRSNAAKADILYYLFQCLVIRIRSPTGRTKGNQLFYLPSYIKRFAPTLSRMNSKYLEKLEQSLLNEFNHTLDDIFQHGNYDNCHCQYISV